MHKFDPAKIDRLMSKEREKELDPEGLLRSCGLKEDDVFADIGSGPGFFSIPASGIVGPYGVVFAIDTQEEMLLHLRDADPPQNIILLRSDEDSIPLANAEVDFALIAFVLHEAANAESFLKEVRRILRPEGTLLVIDWVKKSEEKGPPLKERIDEADARALLSKAGFTSIAASSLTPSHYRITASR